MSDESKPEHPAPWRWIEDATKTVQGEVALVDANGAIVVEAVNCNGYDDGSIAVVSCESPVARELIRLAPEMEALLRKIEWAGAMDWCPCCNRRGSADGHFGDCALAEILDLMDATRRTPG